MNFIDYKSALFSNLNDSTEVIFTAEMPTFINSINICNLVNENIRINLQIVRLLNVTEPKSIYLIKNILIQTNESLNIVSFKDLEISSSLSKFLRE